MRPLGGLKDTNRPSAKQIYDLANDPFETKNLYLRHRDIVAHLQRKLNDAHSAEF